MGRKKEGSNAKKILDLWSTQPFLNIQLLCENYRLDAAKYTDVFLDLYNCCVKQYLMQNYRKEGENTAVTDSDKLFFVKGALQYVWKKMKEEKSEEFAKKDLKEEWYLW